MFQHPRELPSSSRDALIFAALTPLSLVVSVRTGVVARRGQLLRGIKRSQLPEERAKTVLCVRPVDVGSQSEQETGELGQRRHVALEQERDAPEFPVFRDLQGEVLVQ